MQQVLQRLEDEGLYLKKSKCQFGVTTTEFLGHVVGGDRIKPCSNKVDTIRNWPRPDTVTQLRSFLGLCNYYRRFVAGYAGIARPLYQQVTGPAGEQRAPEWDDKTIAAFEQLKQALMDATELRAIDWSKGFTVETDASAYAIGAVLEQEHNGKLAPIAFSSRTLSAAERNY